MSIVFLWDYCGVSIECLWISIGFLWEFEINWNQLKVNWNQLKSNWNQLIQYYSTPVPKKNHIKVKPEVVWRGAYTDQDPTLNNNYFDAFSPGYSSPFGLMLWPLKRGYLANKYSTEFVLNDGRWHRKKNQITGQPLIIYIHDNSNSDVMVHRNRTVFRTVW